VLKKCSKENCTKESTVRRNTVNLVNFNSTLIKKKSYFYNICVKGKNTSSSL